MEIQTTSRWFGINNMEPEYRLPTGWLADAVNVDITRTGALATRTGYTKKINGLYTGAYATKDERMLLVAKGDGVYMVDASATTETKLTTLAGSGDMHFDEINGEVFFSNGVDSGIVAPDGGVRPLHVRPPSAPVLAIAAGGGSLVSGSYGVCCTYRLPDGRESAASDPTRIVASMDKAALVVTGIDVVPGADTMIYVAPADSTEFSLAGVLRGTADGSQFVWSASPDELGEACITSNMAAFPLGCGPIAFSGGRLCAAQYIQPANQSVVWMSEPMAFHLFDQVSGFFMVPGEIRNIFAAGPGLVVATDLAIHAYTHDDSLRRVADFGVPHGHTHATTKGADYLWTNRGLASISADGSFGLMTDTYFSPVSGATANMAVIEQGGQKRLVIATDTGGAAFNQQI